MTQPTEPNSAGPISSGPLLIGPLLIGPNMEVTLHFSLALESGEIVDSTFDSGKPGTFNIGDETLPAGFEKLLIGLRSGDRRSFIVAGEEAFGAWRADNLQRFPRATLEKVSDEPLSQGLSIVFNDASGQGVTGVIHNLPDPKDLENDPKQLVDVDFNHPLAGKNLNFAVEILNVQAKAQVVQFVH